VGQRPGAESVEAGWWHRFGAEAPSRAAALSWGGPAWGGPGGESAQWRPVVVSHRRSLAMCLAVASRRGE
jgi:hypothetical protein